MSTCFAVFPPTTKPPMRMLLPVSTGVRVEMLINRGTSPTFVIAVAVLLLRSGSVTPLVTSALFSIAPAVVVVTTRVIVALPPFVMVPRLHVKTPPEGAAQLPWLGVAGFGATVTLVGRVSVTVTSVAESGPLFVTVIVYATSSPTSTGAGVSTIFVTARFAEKDGAGSTVVVTGPAVLLAVFGS
jgi:hypothetical protein